MMESGLEPSNVYGQLKIFNYPRHVETLSNDKVLAPIHIRIKPTNACSHKCWFCAYGDNELSLGEDMKVRDQIPKEKMKEICDDIISMNVKSVTFSGGGEPLSYSNILPTIKKLGKEGVKIGVITNGRFLNGEIAESLSEYATWVRVSIDGWDGESLARSRNVSEAEFGIIARNIKDFLNMNSSCTLGISYIVTKENHHKILDSVKLFHDFGVHHVKVSPCIVSDCGEENNKYHEPFYEEVLNQLDQAKELNSNCFQVINHFHKSEVDFSKNYESCPYLKFLTIIGADCKVYSCQDKAYSEKGILGDISNRPFKDFWFSSENRKRMKKINPTKHCQHHCVANNKNQILNNYLSTLNDHGSFI
jgi:Fe-coproporphyrin III synthase